MRVRQRRAVSLHVDQPWWRVVLTDAQRLPSQQHKPRALRFRCSRRGWAEKKESRLGFFDSGVFSNRRRPWVVKSDIRVGAQLSLIKSDLYNMKKSPAGNFGKRKVQENAAAKKGGAGGGGGETGGLRTAGAD